jgi:hypothetical protein
MSYCRFENTQRDLDDCVGAMEGAESLSEMKLNEYELKAFKAMCRNVIEFLEHYDRLMLNS